MLHHAKIIGLSVGLSRYILKHAGHCAATRSAYLCRPNAIEINAKPRHASSGEAVAVISAKSGSQLAFDQLELVMQSMKALE
jgi:hypothetical protein